MAYSVESALRISSSLESFQSQCDLTTMNTIVSSQCYGLIDFFFEMHDHVMNPLKFMDQLCQACKCFPSYIGKYILTITDDR